jgi:hypothetical protein
MVKRVSPSELGVPCDQSTSDSGGSSASDSDVPRSAISGKKIKMKLDKSQADLAAEKARKELLRFMNSQY